MDNSEQNSERSGQPEPVTQHINPAYRGQEQAVAQRIQEQGFVFLTDLFTQEPQLPDEWQPSIIPDEHHIKEQQIPETIITKFTNYIKQLRPESRLAWSNAFKAEKGSYYLQHAEQPPQGLLGAYFLTNHWDAEAFRGELTIAKDQPLLIPPHHNSLALIERSEDERIFIKRVTHHAQDNNYTLLLFVWK